MEKFGLKVRALREKKGISREEFCGDETLEAINIGLKDARDGSINLTLIGCKKIPSRGFMHFDMLTSIALPDVTEIGENAFSDCAGIERYAPIYVTLQGAGLACQLSIIFSICNIRIKNKVHKVVVHNLVNF